VLRESNAMSARDIDSSKGEVDKKVNKQERLESH
jgi:hypothetical protein